MTPKTGLSQCRQSHRQLTVDASWEGVCSPSLPQEFGVQRYKFLELDVLDAQIVDQVCKDTLRGMSVLLDMDLISEQTASDSIVFHPADIAVRACAVCGYMFVP